MTLILDGGGLTALANDRVRIAALRLEGLWPPQVPAAVLVEALAGDHRRDHHVNRVLGACQVRVVDEPQARAAAGLRTATGRAATISAVDALVAALTQKRPGAVVLTSDPEDLLALADRARPAITVRAV